MSNTEEILATARAQMQRAQAVLAAGYEEPETMETMEEAFAGIAQDPILLGAFQLNLERSLQRQLPITPVPAPGPLVPPAGPAQLLPLMPPALGGQRPSMYPPGISPAASAPLVPSSETDSIILASDAILTSLGVNSEAKDREARRKRMRFLSMEPVPSGPVPVPNTPPRSLSRFR